MTRDQLKWIAMGSMIVDHTACAFVAPESTAYIIMRLIIGRIAFPIFCVLFVEGFFLTKRPWRHVVDFFIFGLLSEPGYDIVVNGKISLFNSQNVMFTWLIGFLCMIGFQYVNNLCVAWMALQQYKNDTIKTGPVIWVELLSQIGIMVLGLVVAILLDVDYSFIGVLCIILLYVGMKDSMSWKPYQMGFLVGITETAAYLTPGSLLAVPMLYLYKRNILRKQMSARKRFFMKYLFYTAYPIHLSILAGLKLLLV